MPTNDELNSYYASTYRAEYQFAFIRPTKTHRNKKMREAIRRMVRINQVLKPDAPKRTLDFGCGSGELVSHLASCGHEAHGFEQGIDFSSYAKEQIETGRDNATIHSGSWREMKFSAARFDIITCLHVLEHLNEPIAALKKINEWLADDGVLYLETPDMQSYSLKGFDVFHFAHVLGFSRANLMHAAKLAGFKLLHEDEPTSFFLVKSRHAAGRDFEYSLEDTVRKNHEDYTKGVTLMDYLKRHKKRVAKVIRTEVKAGR